MIYKIIFTYQDPATGQRYTMTGTKEGSDASEAKYYFCRRYPRHDIEITEITPIN